MDSKVNAEEDELLATLQQVTDSLTNTKLALKAPMSSYVPDARAMSCAATDLKDLPATYVYIVDVPGVGSGEMKVEVKVSRVLVISGERKREEEEKYLRTQRWMGKLMRKFKLPENADTDAISAMCKNGVLTVTVEKLPPREPTAIEVKMA